MSKEPLRRGPREGIIAANIRAIRRARGWDLAELARRLSDADWPMQVNTLSKIELGQRRVTIDDAYVIADVFDMAIDQITSPICARCHGAPPEGFACLSCSAGTDFGEPGQTAKAPHAPKRRTMTPALLQEVATVYRAGVKAGEPATKGVAEHFGVAHRTAARWVSEARKAGHLGPANGTRQGEAAAP